MPGFAWPKKRNYERTIEMKLTTEQEQKLRELCRADTPNAEIAHILGIPLSEVYANRSRLGITRAKCGFVTPPQKVAAKQAESQPKNNLISRKYIERLGNHPVVQDGKKYYVCLVDAKAYDDKI